MTTILLIILILIVLFTMSRTEMYGTLSDTKEYIEVDTLSIDNDTMQELVLATNKYVADNTGTCTYVIETTSVKKFVHEKNKNEIYRCMFMLMKQHGFSYGFAVTADIAINPDGTTRVLGARTQPIDVVPPSDTSPFDSDITGHVFTDYNLFKKSELELIKQKSM
jgi:hypothetical protein